jgi:hypothetical protein
VPPQKPATKLEVAVALERAPALFQPVGVTVTVRGARHLPGIGDVEAWMTFPPTVAFINGTTRWRGKLGPLETRTFAATVAFVAEGTSSISAEAFYKYTDPATQRGEIGAGSGSQGLWVDATGGQLNAVSREPSYVPIPNYPRDGSVLLNATQRPRVLLITDPSGWYEVAKLGLPPADPWGPWRYSVGSHPSPVGTGMGLVLIDQQRPTTGYHLAILRPWSDNSARQIIIDGGVGDPERVTIDPRKLAAYQGPSPVLLDLIATAPRPDWPVETRPVSPYQVTLVPIPDEDPRDSRPDQIVEFVVRVNGQVVGRQTVVRGPQSALVELPLAAFQPRSSP